MSGVARRSATRTVASIAIVVAYISAGVFMALAAVAGAAGIRHYTSTLLTSPATLIQLERREDERERRCTWWAKEYQMQCLPLEEK